MPGVEQTLTTGADGKVRFKVLPNQKYILKETATVRGYALLPQPVVFMVDGSGKVKVISGKGSVNTVTGGDKSLTVVNYPEGRLPLSGLAGSLQVLLAGVLLLGVLLGLLYLKGKSDEFKETFVWFSDRFSGRLARYGRSWSC